MALAYKIVRDFPDAIKTIDNSYKNLYNYRDYVDVARILNQMEESKYMMELILMAYTQVIKEAKGKNNE